MTSLPEWIDAELWDEYVAQRKKDKKAMSPRSERDRLARLYALKAAGYDPNACIAEALNYHWLEFYEPKDKAISRKASSEADATRAYLDGLALTPEQRAASDRARKVALGALRRVS